MSFILDALKKSEAERQRQAGPTLLELRITHPRRRYPLWSLIVGGLLAANIVVLLMFVLNRTPAAAIASAPGAPSGAAGAGSASTAVTAATPAAAVRVMVAPGSVASPTPAVTRVAPRAPPPATAPEAASAPAAASASATTTGAAAGGAGNVPDVSAQTRNPADYEPALPPGSQPQTPPPTSQASAVDYANLPSISQISGNIPAMQLNLLISSDVPSERYALINMQRVHEGDVLSDGARVLAIMPSGVAMDYRGQDFLLRPGGTAQ